MSNFGVNLKINKNQLLDAVLQRVTNATQAAAVNTRGQLGYNDTIEKIIYFDGTAIRIVASETYVNSQIAANALTVAPASANLIDITGNQISLKALAIQKVLTDAVSTTLAAALAARTPVYNATNVGNGTADLQEGDVLILAAATGGQQVYIQNGGVAGTTADFTLLETPNINNAAIRALFSATNGLTYNSGTGEFKLGGGLVDATTTIDLTNNNTTFQVISVGVFFRLVRATTTRRIEIGNNLGTFIEVRDNSTLINIQSGGTVPIEDFNATPRGLQYAADYGATFNARSLVDKGYVDGLAVKRSTQTVTTVAATPLTITHNFALADKDSIQVSVWKAGVQFFVDVETVDANSIRITTSQAEVGLKIFMIA